jgi:hypothetical protein
MRDLTQKTANALREAVRVYLRSRYASSSWTLVLGALASTVVAQDQRFLVTQGAEPPEEVNCEAAH